MKIQLKSGPLIYLIAILLCLAASSFETAFTHKWVVLKDCSVKVNGTTNVNKFSCSIPEYTQPDTISLRSGNIAGLSMSGQLALPVLNFDCNNQMMTNDLRKTLKAKEFPKLYIRFLSMEKYPDLKAEAELITGIVNIELAGVVKKVKVNYRITTDAQQVIHLVGKQTVNFSDFNLKPPKRLAGMVRANDLLNVEFRVNFRIVS